MNLGERQRGEEKTDDLSLSGEEMGRNLQEIGWVNRYLGGHKASWYGLRRLLPDTEGTRYSIADFGCGGGDTLRYLCHQLAYEDVDLFGVDGNAYTINFARRASKAYPEIEYLHGNFLHHPVKDRNFDIIHSSLTCHHFDRETLVKLFRQLYDQSRFGFVINDLHRHRLAVWGIRALNGIAIRTELGKHDGLQSVYRGFRRHELEEMMQEAGIPVFKIYWRWAFRWVVIAPKGKASA